MRPTTVSVRVRFITPFALSVPEGLYETDNPDETLELEQMLDKERASSESIGEQAERLSAFSLLVKAPDTQDEEEQDRLRRRYAAHLLQRANRFLRWYRAVSREVQVGELTLAQARRFTYEQTETQQPWCDDLLVEFPLPPAHTDQQVDIAEVAAAIRRGLKTGTDPELADLYLLDAKQFTREGRFREAVLNCWSVIDATFTMRFERLATQKLQGEWSDGSKAFSSHESSLKHRMSVGMHFVAGRSLFREPGNFWQDMTTSYEKRNGIIHRGESAADKDAALALRVATTVVSIMDAVEAQAAATTPNT